MGNRCPLSQNKQNEETGKDIELFLGGTVTQSLIFSFTGGIIMENTNNDFVTTTQEPAIIEVYRISRWVGMLCACKIFLDDNEIGRVSNGDKKKFEISPGLHEIRIKMNWSFLKSRPFSFKIKNGDFTRLRFDFTFGGFATFTSWWMVKSIFSGGKVIKIEQY